MRALPDPRAQIEWNAASNAQLILIEDVPGDSQDDPIDLDPEVGSQDNPYKVYYDKNTFIFFVICLSMCISSSWSRLLSHTGPVYDTWTRLAPLRGVQD
ncbi:hypothetical protein TSTA_010370 [Talaromyces stipitatus ATCC 10500]|uniref:Uncharacterized protein n=1 Tax=Talaromyces stipitatus (strain ATCC 10500 / CBS 375.48 / QM 6759 / NRRL 1006) TaxID=441959 RepID=B8MG52_TALSN|nr:uncharacterized protein TSTA_010370 [Talaromyces stipitatus ATCC 10500]EED15919.1 hypothetical protein TSTA_010370 [Talaromyces stipitatus ATCC 10500]